MKTLQKYYTKRVKSISVLLETPRERYTPATFHSIRVEIKKINSVFKLIEYNNKRFNFEKKFKNLKKIFKLAGKVRSAQMEQWMLKKYMQGNSLQHFFLSLKQKEKQLIENYFILINEFFCLQLKEDLIKIDPLLVKLTKKSCLKYVKVVNGKMNENLQSKKKVKQSNLHKLREIIKQDMYLAKAVNLNGSKTSKPGLEKLADLIGKWHDNRLLQLHLKKIIKKECKSVAEIYALHEIALLVSKNKENYLKNIKKVLFRYK